MASNATDIIETNPITDIPGTSTRDNTTVPPQPNTDLPSSPENSSTVTPICCCGYARDESLTPESAQHNGCCSTAPPVLRRLLNSVPIYILILITTFIVVFLLLAELLIDLGIIVVPDNSVNSSLSVGSVGQVTPYIGPEAQRVSTILHWISFSILSLFFIEVVLRLYAWKLNIVRHIVLVIDCAVVTMSIATNIATTLAAGVTSPFDSISLIIVLRFIHVYSLVKRVVDESRQVVQEKLRKTESNLNEAQISIQRLNRQALDKDFEIKQLRGFLGARAPDLDDELRKAFAARDDTLGACGGNANYDSQLQQAINLSKEAYANENGYTNYGFSDQTDDNFHSVTVHHRQNSVKRALKKEKASQEFLPQTGENQSSDDVTHGNLHSTMEINGDTAALLSSNSNNSNNKEWTVNYCLGLETDNPFPALAESNSIPIIDPFPKGNPLEPISKPCITVSIDPTILLTPDDQINDSGVCDSDDGLGSSNSSRHETGSAILSSNDLMSSDASCVSSFSTCSESGYQSEDKVNPANVPRGNSPRAKASESELDSGDGSSVNTIRSNQGSTRLNDLPEAIEMKGTSSQSNSNHFEKEEHRL